MLCSQNRCCGQGCHHGSLEVKKWDYALSRTLVSTFQGHLKNVKKQFWKWDVVCCSLVILLCFAYPVVVYKHMKILACSNTKLVSFYNNVRQRGKYGLHLTDDEVMMTKNWWTDLPKVLYWTCGRQEKVTTLMRRSHTVPKLRDQTDYRTKRSSGFSRLYF